MSEMIHSLDVMHALFSFYCEPVPAVHKVFALGTEPNVE